ncbi:4-oxalocrotonate tautomerase [Pleomorphomonas diazotrophica]|uniref:4-oxalocrotonate tautomerase n=1 Tax=Pleomorphomonas diazotrophica TaxID=1166257 RepID=A0A1I4UMW9_9HYPH|nr:tautomerase family protein [Pleomorphomonas diazotrophica]PKR88350.1 4-oxalocrotonate tautomerase [Pleomorphomonas diazotrophica]SFM90332.1 4-oxalocrotonate tautomerase [Pleomorphomonas diazotrophica]
MPHVVIKMIEGRSEEQKRRTAELVTQAIMDGIGCKESSVSVAIEDLPAAEWVSAVYRPEIEPQMDRLYKKPGYKPE